MLPAFAFALAVERLDPDFEAVDARRRLRKDAGGLVDHEHGAVVVEDVEHRVGQAFQPDF